MPDNTHARNNSKVPKELAVPILKGSPVEAGETAAKQLLETSVASAGRIKSENRALAQALVYQMQQALAKHMEKNKSASTSRSKSRKSPNSASSPGGDGEPSQRPQRRQHIVRRDDGSILIINYEDFNQLISQPLSSIVTSSSGGSSGSNRQSSGTESSSESSRSGHERGPRHQSSSNG